MLTRWYVRGARTCTQGLNAPNIRHSCWMIQNLVQRSSVVARLCLHSPVLSPQATRLSHRKRLGPSAAQHSMAPAGQTRGAFILFEGIDRSGKTTQCSKLVEHLVQSHIAAELWRFPDRTSPVGQMINSYLTNGCELVDNAVHLMFAANRWEKSKALVQALEAGTTLVVDRYSYSGLAYSLAKGVPGMGMEWCWGPEVGLPAPDIVFYMRVSPEVSASRSNYGEERYEKAEFQQRVSSKFDTLQDQHWVVIDAAQPIDTIHAQVCTATAELLSSGKLQQPVRTFQSHTDTSHGHCFVQTSDKQASKASQQIGAEAQANGPAS